MLPFGQLFAVVAFCVSGHAILKPQEGRLSSPPHDHAEPHHLHPPPRGSDARAAQFFFLAALLSSMRRRISASSSSMDLSILAPREGSLPCILAGRVGSCSPAICSSVFFLPLPSSGSFWSLAAARRLAMLRSSSVWVGRRGWSA